jgi:hypothetical protein
MENQEYSLWHCRVLYVLSRSPLKKVSQLTGWAISKLSMVASSENWEYRREKFHNALAKDPVKACNPDHLELLLGEFLSIPGKHEFVQHVLDHAVSTFAPANPAISGVNNPLDAIAHRLTEHGIDLETARNIIASAVDPTSQDVANFIGQTDSEIDLLKEIDDRRLGYSAVASQYDKSIARTLNNCESFMKLCRREIDRVTLTLPHNYTAEDLMAVTAGQGVKWFNQISQSLSRTADTQMQLSGCRRYIEHDANVAKFAKNGYMVVETEVFDQAMQQRKVAKN